MEGTDVLSRFLSLTPEQRERAIQWCLESFNRRIEALNRQREEILARTLRPFEYTPLRLDHRVQEIRLLSLLPGERGESDDVISCRISVADLSNSPRYEALSYRWGDASETRLITIEDEERGATTKFQITVNLFLAMTRLRCESERMLWVDAICIDQQNEVEKSVQVGMMRNIYEKAQRTLIWLGEESNNSRKPFRRNS